MDDVAVISPPVTALAACKQRAGIHAKRAVLGPCAASPTTLDVRLPSARGKRKEEIGTLPI